MATLPHHPPETPHPLLRAAIAEEILALQGQRRATHDPFMRVTIDAKIKRLLSLLQRVATAAMLAIMVMPWPASPQSLPYIAPPSTVCMAYHDAAKCVVAIRDLARHCEVTKYAGLDRNEKIARCLTDALDETGGRE